MDKITIDGVNLTTLEIITNKQGSIFNEPKKSDSDFKRFGEAYFFQQWRKILSKVGISIKK